MIKRGNVLGHSGIGSVALTLMLALGACSGDVSPRGTTVAQPRQEALRAEKPLWSATAGKPASAVPHAQPQPASAAVALDKDVQRLGRGFDGDLGIAVRDVQTGWASHYRGLDYFPQQSVSKLWVSLTALSQADEDRIDLARPVTLTAKDLTLFHQPIRALLTRPGGYRTTPAELMVRALTQSDNSANDRLLREVGGSDAVRRTLDAKGISGIRFGPGEKKLQASIAGLGPEEWAGGGGFYTAREALPKERRQAAFDAYIADPIDGATPLAIVDALARLNEGELLSAPSTARLIEVMGQTRTGALRLKSGLEPGWTLSHKTGTGQVLGDEQAGYNDVGLLTSPEGRRYALAVMIGRTSQPLQRRSALMRKVVEATIDYDRALAKQRSASS